MNEIGLAVGVWKRNYGGVLQAYALLRTLEALGVRPEVISIRPFENDIRLRKMKFFAGRLIDREERQYVASMLKTKLRKVFAAEFRRNSKLRDARYRDFLEKNFRYSGRELDKIQLVKRCREYQAVVLGSDQLWRPSNIAGDFFTLNFVPSDVTKIAYATSFGVARIPLNQHGVARRFLQRIEHISVREEAGRDIVREISGRDVPVVCDPSMLMDARQWMGMQTEAVPPCGDFILCYYLGANPVFRRFARRLSVVTGLPIVGLLHGATYIPQDDAFPDFSLYDVGPGEFVSLIRKASFVCTDSFHGTVFSILHKRRFFSFRRFADNRQLSTNDRLATLLGWSGLKDRFLVGDEDAMDFMDAEVDYGPVMERVSAKREEGIAFLSKALSSSTTPGARGGEPAE